jgi:UDP-glucose 4-epimerase
MAPFFASAERRSRAELAEERTRRHARDRAELGDEMRLVVERPERSEAASPNDLPCAAIKCALSCAIRRAPLTSAKMVSSLRKAICSMRIRSPPPCAASMPLVHCAAFFRGATAEQARAVNDLGTQRLASAARAASVRRFVFTSTGLVYGANGGRPAREDDPCDPIDGYPASKLAAERFLLAIEGLDVRVLRLPFVYGDGDPHIEEVVPMMRGFPPAQRMSIAHHADVAQAVAGALDTTSTAHRIYNVVDDEAPELATLFASVGASPPDGSDAERARAFDALLDGKRIREDLGFKPTFPRLADAIVAGLGR